MCASPADYDALDWRAADTARLTGSRVNVVVQLEETGDSVCVDVIGDR